MRQYLLAEHLKHKRSFLKKLIVVAPLVAVLHAFVIMPYYFSSNAYNWWYVVLMPATLSLIPALIHQREDRKLKYRAVFPLDIDLKACWMSKVAVAAIYLSVAEFIHMASVGILQPSISLAVQSDYAWGTLALASALLLLVNLWQIPLCLFLAKKIGFVASVVGNTALGAVLGLLFADGPYWLYCPYAWGTRLMVPILHVLPNGLIAGAGDAMVTDTALALPCILSVALFVTLTLATARWFSKCEVKA
ncbi:MAG: lantibiotic immunity ABC transporter MutE/EpiE family permease subunit [Peptoniphilus sp.]|nr:lantibiotic immunity ABC transporter MutE/EpiE family permease subunit [Peptoniphilus sp.]MDD7362676.1 lantibiotic immunity ABC transporter MutE/EpiE family permease subunit [Bacillota bacterium]MDY6044925.1 lantibiotic immunity ABC transporter MutE/EpiE family permease subunit [Peptoniphilus sp.]